MNLHLLAEAIREKYTPKQLLTPEEAGAFRRHHLVRRPPLTQLRVISLHNLNLAHPTARDEAACEAELLSQVCPRVEEVDLRGAKGLTWPAVFSLCTQWTQLQQLDLSAVSLGPLDEAESASFGCPHLHLRVLILNEGTQTWPQLVRIARCFPHLQQLVLRSASLGSTMESMDSHGVSLPDLELLNLVGNGIQSTAELFPFLAAFAPALRRLILSENPIKRLTVASPLPSLLSLTVADTGIDSWDSVDAFWQLPSLTEIRLTNTPLASRYSDATLFRKLVIGRLPCLKTLNGGAVSNKEREDAERAFIRYYDPKIQQDASVRMSIDFNSDAAHKHLERLTVKHGQLDPLASVDLKAPMTVSILLRADGHPPVLRSLSVYTCARELKELCEESFKIPPKNQTLYYDDVGAEGRFGLERISVPTKTLAQLNARDGDIIFCEDKTSLPSHNIQYALGKGITRPFAKRTLPVPHKI